MNTDELKKTSAGVAGGVVVNSVNVGGVPVDVPRTSKVLIHVECGDAVWDPTEEELEEITQLFLRSLEDKDTVIATRHGVKVSVFELPL